MKRWYLCKEKGKDQTELMSLDPAAECGRRRCWREVVGTVVGTVVLLASASASCQDMANGPSNIVVPQLRPPATLQRADVGTRLVAPTETTGPDRSKPQIQCQFECSAFVPRSVISRITFPERIAPSPDVLRVDVAINPMALQAGNFGSVPLRVVPEVQVQSGAGIDVERVRTLVTPTYFDKVEAHAVVPRDPMLEPQRLQQLQMTRTMATASQELREAIARDAMTGGLEQMRVLAQGMELRRTVPHRSLVVEGMQQGMAYEVRLVQDNACIAQNVCRVPVCPADLVDE